MSVAKDDLSIKDAHVGHEEEAKGQPAAIAATLNEKDQRPDPWGKGHRKLYCFCIIIYFCSTMNGTYHTPNSSGLYGTTDQQLPRLRWLPDGLHQCSARVPAILQHQCQ